MQSAHDPSGTARFARLTQPGSAGRLRLLFLHLAAVACVAAVAWTGMTRAGQEGLAFEAAWIRAMPPGMSMTAGYGRFRNTGAEVVELLSYSSPEFGEVTLHRTEIVDGVSRMRDVSVLPIPPGEAVALEPGGYHLMLMAPEAPLAEGRLVTLQVFAKDGSMFRFEVPVQRQ